MTDVHAQGSQGPGAEMQLDKFWQAAMAGRSRTTATQSPAASIPEVQTLALKFLFHKWGEKAHLEVS